MTRRSRHPIVLLLAGIALAAVGCGGDDDAGESTSTAPPSVTADEPSSTTAAPAVTTTEAPPTTTTTEPPPAGPAPLALDDIPELVAAWRDGTGEPLELAQAIIGFPLAIPTPDNTTPLHLSVDLFGGDTEATWEWDWTYEVLSDDPMPDIDIRSEEPSPGTVALRDFYNPIMAELGWTYSNSTGSDPGDEGGPQSINHVYQSEQPTIVANGLTATPKPAFVWADEEQVFGEGVPGYQVDLPLQFEAGVVPVPLIRTIIDELPAIDGARLFDVRLDSRNRSDTSFDAEYGLRYFEVSLGWALAPGTTEDVKATIGTGLGSTAFFAGEESFFEPGFVEPTEPRLFGEDWTQPLVFLDRYEGSATVSDGDDGGTLEVKVTFEPNRVVLEELPD